MLIATLISFLILFALIAYALHRRKATGAELRLMGMIAVANTPLIPEGSVLVDGELWKARSNDGQLIEADSILRVIGSANHLLLVESAQ